MFEFLAKLTSEYKRQWIISWFVCGALILFFQFFRGEINGFEIFKLIVALIGMTCAVSLAFRRRLAGNGLGIAANVGEVLAQGGSGATGLMLYPFYSLCMHIYGLRYWAKHQDDEGNVIPKPATGFVWLFAIVFVVVGLLLFPWINDQLQQYSFIKKSGDTAVALLGITISWYSINIFAFVIAVTAMTMMILRYAAAWWLWILSNFVWLAVNLANHNTIFATQTCLYQINAFVGCYNWWANRSVHNVHKEQHA